MCSEKVDNTSKPGNGENVKQSFTPSGMCVVVFMGIQYMPPRNNYPDHPLG